MAQTRDADVLEQVMRFYDYIELQPLENYRYLIDRNSIVDEDRLKEILQGIIDMADRLGKPIVATSDAHYVHPRHEADPRHLHQFAGDRRRPASAVCIQCPAPSSYHRAGSAPAHDRGNAQRVCLGGRSGI